jgi:ATP-binding cassette subfamily B (MDR/TAP) protein 1
MQLLLRFYEPTKGAILINGIDIKDFDLKYLRSHLGMVGQEPAVFHGSFRENIRYSSLNATEEDIRLAAQKANALNFIADNNPECDN